MIKVEAREVPVSPVEWHKQLKSKHDKRFYQIFRIHLAALMTPYFGFDVIAFDDLLKTPDGTSTVEWVREKYGQEAMDIMYDLISPMPKLDQVPTWVDMTFDLSKKDTKGFVPCEFLFTDTGGGELTGEGYYKRGLIVHRRFNALGKQVDGSGCWSISTRQGLIVKSDMSLKEAKIKASQLCQAIDFEQAQTFNLTDEQGKAVKRVGDYWAEEATNDLLR